MAIGWANTRRFLRQRSNLFFVFVFPILIILLLGMMYGGGMGYRIGVHVAGSGGPLAASLVACQANPVSGRQQLVLVSEEQAQASSAQAEAKWRAPYSE